MYYDIKNMKDRDKLFIDIAKRVSEMSYAKRNKVGGILVKDKNIISFGWNGTPTGFNNKCEDDKNMTLPEVIHAEMNIYAKLARNGGSAKGSVLYLTLSPCYECGKLIIQSGTKRVVYLEQYRNPEPIKFLLKAGVKCVQYKEKK